MLLGSVLNLMPCTTTTTTTTTTTSSSSSSSSKMQDVNLIRLGIFPLSSESFFYQAPPLPVSFQFYTFCLPVFARLFYMHISISSCVLCSNPLNCIICRNLFMFFIFQFSSLYITFCWHTERRLSYLGSSPWQDISQDYVEHWHYRITFCKYSHFESFARRRQEVQHIQRLILVSQNLCLKKWHN